MKHFNNIFEALEDAVINITFPTTSKIEVSTILSMAHSPVKNYVVPGLAGYLISGEPSSEHGCVRLFTSDLDQQMALTPHSRRYDFTCYVLSGQVVNRIWKISSRDRASPYACSSKILEPVVDGYTIRTLKVEPWMFLKEGE